MKYNRDECCRICLGMLSQEKYNITEEIRKMIAQCVPSMDKLIEFSDKICQNCYSNLNISYFFINVCLQTIIRLEKITDEGDFGMDDFDFDINTDDNLSFPFDFDLKKTELPDSDVPEIADHCYAIDAKDKLGEITGVDRVAGVCLDDDIFGNVLKEIKDAGMKVIDNVLNEGTGRKRIILLGEAVLKCQKCSAIFYTEETLELHKGSSACATPRMTMCEHCGAVFKQKRNYWQHYKQVHKPLLQCGKCKHLSKTEEDATNHKNECVKSKFVCKRCHLSFDTKQEKQKHMLEKHNIGPRQPRPAMKNPLCHVCGKVCKDSAALSVHQKIHSGRKMCNICDKVLANEMTLKNHILFNHMPKVMKEMCEICGMKFRRKSALTKHMERHDKTREKTHPCPICEKKFFKKSTIKLHIETAHESNPSFFCELCGKGFFRLYNLNLHLKACATGRSPRAKTIYTCLGCKEEFTNIHKFEAHLKLHDPITRRQFICDICNVAFVTYQSLRNHKKSHRIHDLTLMCRVCYRKCKSKQELDSHQMTHAIRKKHYKCEECGELFARRFILENHIVRSHTNPDFSEFAFKGNEQKDAVENLKTEVIVLKKH